VTERKLQKVEKQPCAYVTARRGQTSSDEQSALLPPSVPSYPLLPPCTLAPLTPSSPAQELSLGDRAEASDGQEAALRTRHSTRRPNQPETSGVRSYQPLCHQPLMPAYTLPLLTPSSLAQELGLGVRAEASDGQEAALRTRPSTRRPAHLEHGGELFQPLSPQPLMPACAVILLTPSSLAQELGLGVRAEASDGQDAALCIAPSTRGPTQLEHGGELYQPLSP
jgi:hypothetical protein